jgi:hypothetical protein
MRSKYKICYGIWGRMNCLIYSSASLEFPKNEEQRKQIEITIKQLTDNKTEKKVLYTKRFGHFATKKGTEIVKEVDFILPYHESEKILNQIKNII